MAQGPLSHTRVLYGYLPLSGQVLLHSEVGQTHVPPRDPLFANYTKAPPLEEGAGGDGKHTTSRSPKNIIATTL